MPLTSFSLEKYNEARRRLKELSSKSTSVQQHQQEQEEDDGDILQDKTNVRSSSSDKAANVNKGKTRTSSSLSTTGNKCQKKKGIVSPVVATGGGGSGPDDILNKLTCEVDEAREVLIGAIRTSGLRTPRESGLLSALTKLDRLQNNRIEALQECIEKSKAISQGLRRKLLESEERIDAAEHAVEDERREVLGKARSLVMEADAKRETEVRVLKEQIEEERKRLVSETSKARDEWQQAKLKEMEEKMIRDLERTTAKLMKESKANVNATIERLEEEYERSCEAQEVRIEEAVSGEERAMRLADDLRDERDDLEAELVEARNEVKELKKKLTTQQQTQAMTTAKVEELEASFKDVIESMKQEIARLMRRHEEEIIRLNEERAKELEEVDTRIRKSLATKDESMLKLKIEAEEAKKDAATARILLIQIYNGLVPIEKSSSSTNA